ncbi:MAG: hypothetical protein AB7Y46_07055 [Armatimonadota bacterium]
MLALIIATVFNAGFGIVVRDAQRRGLDLLTVGLVNYIVAAGFYALWSSAGDRNAGDARTALIGTIGGVIYAAGFLLMLGPLRWRGLGVVAALVGLSVTVPMTASLVVWHERLLGVHAAGAALALLAIPLLSLDRGAGHQALTALMAVGLAALFLINGSGLLVQKWYHTTGLAAQRPLFLTYLFGVAALAMVAVWAARSRRMPAASVGSGAVLGVCNIVANLALLAALDRLPGAAVFPVMQAGVMIVAAGFAAVAWREKPGRLGTLGISIAAAAVVMINLA